MYNGFFFSGILVYHYLPWTTLEIACNRDYFDDHDDINHKRKLRTLLDNPVQSRM